MLCPRPRAANADKNKRAQIRHLVQSRLVLISRDRSPEDLDFMQVRAPPGVGRNALCFAGPKRLGGLCGGGESASFGARARLLVRVRDEIEAAWTSIP